MTIIRFSYSVGYHRPATGGVVFMPHRKHAANETVVLPRPFTRPLVDGVVEVDLEPTSDNWLWSVTHDRDTWFYAIPDTDGVIEHTDLVPVAPSTLTHHIEPVWWAELRQHQQFIADYVNESRSSVREAIDTANTIHTTLQTAVNDAQRHESVAGAYSRQAQLSATEIHNILNNDRHITWELQQAREQVLPARDETLEARDETLQHGITVDTSVGTRVFVGDTMIYGDTGWRTLYADGLPNKFDGRIDVRRIDDLVYMLIFNISLPAGEGAHTILSGSDDDIPLGFRPSSSRRQQGIISGRSNPNLTHFISAFGSIVWTKTVMDNSITIVRPAGDIVGMIPFWTDNPWPTSLPGNPT